MKRDIVSSIFWVLLAIYFTIESYRFGLGDWGMPGPGYFPFGAGLLFGIISLSVMLSALRKVPKEMPRESLERLQWKNIVLIIAGMLAYILCLNKVGFIVCTFLLVVFFIRIVAHWRWFNSIVIALSITLAFHLFFDALLNAQLPMGLFKFLRG
jgi:hypothetical protein